MIISIVITDMILQRLYYNTFNNNMGANWSKFHLAAKVGDTDTVVAMIDAGDSIEQITDDKYGVTALHVAAVFGRASVIHVLLSRGTQIEQECKDCQTPLILAAMLGHQDVVSMKISMGTLH